MLQPTLGVVHKQVFLYLSDIYALSMMCYELITSEHLEDIYKEYEIILKEKNIQHQFICGISSTGNLLGCIDPIYRYGKPLKFQMDSRRMILALCDDYYWSNIQFKTFPEMTDIKDIRSSYHPINFKIHQVELIPLQSVQRADIHFTQRPYIEFDQVDTFSSLFDQWSRATAEPQPSFDQKLVVQPNLDHDAFNFEQFMSFLE